MRPREYTYFILGMSLFLLGISSAHATTVLHEEFEIVTGNTVIPIEEIADLAPGIYEATLVDYELPVAFDILTLGIIQEIAPQVFVPLGYAIGTSSFTFDITSPGTILANLVAHPGTGGAGTYGLQIKAIPIPPAAMLFLSGLIGLVLVARRSSRLGTA